MSRPQYRRAWFKAAERRQRGGNFNLLALLRRLFTRT